MKVLQTYFWKRLPIGASIWLAPIWLSAQIAQPTSNHLKTLARTCLHRNLSDVRHGGRVRGRWRDFAWQPENLYSRFLPLGTLDLDSTANSCCFGPLFWPCLCLGHWHLHEDLSKYTKFIFTHCMVHSRAVHHARDKYSFFRNNQTFSCWAPPSWEDAKTPFESLCTTHEIGKQHCQSTCLLLQFK